MYFKNEYKYHMKTIRISIYVQTCSIICIITSKFIYQRYHDQLLKLELKTLNSVLTDKFQFPISYLLINILGIYFPATVQILLVKLSIIGNWNELLQSDLIKEDEEVSVHSKMFNEIEGMKWSSLLVSENINPTNKSLFKLGSEYDSVRRSAQIISNRSSLIIQHGILIPEPNLIESIRQSKDVEVSIS